MKKLVLLALTVFMTACPVACVNDPTESDETCVDTSTDVSCDVTEVQTDTATDVE